MIPSIQKEYEKRAHNMGDIANIILVGIMALLGGIPSICMFVSIPVILAGKISRKIKYGSSLYD